MRLDFEHRSRLVIYQYALAFSLTHLPFLSPNFYQETLPNSAFSTDFSTDWQRGRNMSSSASRPTVAMLDFSGPPAREFKKWNLGKRLEVGDAEAFWITNHPAAYKHNLNTITDERQKFFRCRSFSIWFFQERFLKKDHDLYQRQQT